MGEVQPHTTTNTEEEQEVRARHLAMGDLQPFTMEDNNS